MNKTYHKTFLRYSTKETFQIRIYLTVFCCWDFDIKIITVFIIIWGILSLYIEKMYYDSKLSLTHLSTSKPYSSERINLFLFITEYAIADSSPKIQIPSQKKN